MKMKSVSHEDIATYAESAIFANHYPIFVIYSNL